MTVTQGLLAAAGDRLADYLAAVAAFDDFSADNDPYGEHDFGRVEVEGETVLFKIDYYDLEFIYASPDPANPLVTERVMTVMLASEY